MSKLQRLILLFFFSVGIHPINSFSQICDFSTPICDLNELITGDPVSMPDTSSYKFKEDIDREIPKLRNYFIDAGVNWALSGCPSAFSLDNPTIYTLTAIDENAEINFEFFDCEAIVTQIPGFPPLSEKGFQVALIRNCEIPEMVICEDNQNVDNIDLPITITNAEIGDEYYLVIDGYGGSRCDYRIASITGFAVDNVKPIESVVYDGIDVSLNPEICSTIDGPILTINSPNSDALIDSRWRIFDNTGTLIYSPKKSGHFLKLPDLITDSPGQYTFDVELISPCTEVKEELLPGSFIIVEETASEEYQLDLCGPGPFDTLDVQITTSGLMEFPFNSGTECESFIRIDSRILHVENPMLSVNSCNQIEFSGSIIDEGMVDAQFVWKNSNNNQIDNNNTDPRIFNIGATEFVSLDIILTGFTESCVVPVDGLQATFSPLSFDLSCHALDTETVELNWETVSGASGYILTVDGVEQLVGASQTNLIINNLERETTINIELTATLPGGCSPSAVTSCTTLLCDSSRNLAIAIANSDSLICTGDAQLPIQFKPILSGQTEQPIVTWFINNQVDPDGIFDPSIAGNGVYQISARLDDGGCQAVSETIQIEITGFDETSNFEIDERVCVNTDVELTLTGTRYDASDYNITETGGAIESGNVLDGLIYNWPSLGTHTISMFLEDNSCRSTSEIIKTVTVEEVNDVKGLVAIPNSLSVIFEWDEVPCAESYVVYVNDQREEVTTQTRFSYIFEQIEDVVDVRVGIETGSCFCPLDSKTVTARKSLCPNITLDIREVPPICLAQGVNTEPVILDVNIIGKEGEGELVWSGIGVLADGRFLPNLADVGLHTVTVSYTENACPSTNSIDILVSQQPDPVYDILGSNCPGEDSRLVIEDFDNYMVFANDELVNNADYTLEEGTYMLEFINEDGCTHQEEITIEPVLESEVSISGERSVKEGFSLNYGLNTDFFGYKIDEILWTYRGEAICEADCNESIRIQNFTKSGELCATVNFNGECRLIECIDIDVEPALKVYVPNSILYNGRNSNDRFRVILSNDVASLEEVSVFDRIGEKVYTEQNITSIAEYKGWDGLNMNSEQLMPGVYVYMVKIRRQDGSLDVKMGDVTLLH